MVTVAGVPSSRGVARRVGTSASRSSSAVTAVCPSSTAARSSSVSGNLEFPAVKWDGSAAVIDTEARWVNARRLLHDGTAEHEDRVAGLLVLLYAQWPAAISRLTLAHVQTSAGTVRLRLAANRSCCPNHPPGSSSNWPPEEGGHAALGDQGTSPWLFPGG
jgi:hypothetical protein